MRIDSLPPLMARSLLAALPKVASGFPMDEPETVVPRPPLAQGPGTAHPVPSVAMLVTLSAVDPQIERRRKLAQDASRGLDALDRLHKEVLAGTPSVKRLREIADWSQSFDVPDEPMLASILADIDLRVRVELAKHDIEA